MTKKYSTKRALLSSVLALLLCLSSFVGTTFAWFTDSVTSANNIITSGKLDIELYHSDASVTDEVVDSSIELFDDVTLWEPGVMVWEEFTIANKGNLALKYQFTLNVLEATIVNGKSFAEMLKVAVVENGLEEYNRENVEAITEWSSLATFISDGELAAEATETFGIVIWWQPSENDNDFNMNNGATETVSVTVGVNLFATQASAESDAFGSDYDNDAWGEGMQVLTADDLQAAINNGVTNIVLVEDIVVDEPIVIPAAATTYSMRSTAPAVVIDLNGKTITTAYNASTQKHLYAFENYGDLVLMNGTINARGIYNYGNMVIENATINAIDINGGFGVQCLAGATLIMNSGKIAVTEDDNFGAVTSGGYDATPVRIEKGASFIMNGGVIDNAADYTFAIDSYGDVVVNGGVIKSVHSTVSSYGTLTINGGSFACNGIEDITAHVIVAWKGSTTTINGGTFDGKDNYNGFNVDTEAGANVVINGGNFLPVHSGSLYGNGTITVCGGIFFDAISADRVADGYSAVESNGSYVVLPGAKVEEIADGFYFDGKSTYYITTAEGLFAFAASVNKYSNYEYPYKDQTVVLWNDIDLENAEWTPIGDYRFSANRFCGTFDGQGHTISNFKITKKTDKNDSNKSSYGFFGNVEGTVKNLTVANATVSSYAYCGALIGRLNSGLVENCHVVNSTVATSYWQGGIMIGQVNGGSVKDCTVTNSSISGKSALGGISGPVTAEDGDILFENCSVKDSAINQVGSFGGNYDKYFGGMFGYLESGDSRIDLNNCTVINTTVKGEMSSKLSGDNDGNIYFNGVKGVTSAEELKSALLAGGNIVLGKDIAMESVYIKNPNFVLDGNGYTITQTGTNTYALIDTQGGSVTLKNVTFDGINGGGVVRTVDAKFNAYNVTVQNSNHTQQQGLFRLLGESTIENCTFVNNICSMAISLNYDGANNDPQVVKNCVFENNTCNSTAVVYYVKGAGCTVTGNKFIGNTVTVTDGNAATLYMGFTENNVITNNVFENNTVNAGTSKRVAGALMIGYNAVITGNAFVGNKVNGENAKGNDVCASVYYTDIDLSGNYWGGNAPVAGDDYYQEYTNHNVIINDYLTTYGE